MDASNSAFVSFDTRSAHVVCDERFAAEVRAALEHGSLYEYAIAHRGSRPLAGRGVAYAVSLPNDATSVVVRHNRHGGLLAALTGDLFLWPSRAPLELENSLRLLASGVPTPELVCYALYRVIAGLCRADVVTVEIQASRDLSTAITSRRADDRALGLRAAARLVTSLTAAGARHHDLNVKNVLLRDGASGELEALVLDVDRVAFSNDHAAVREANLARLLRSARKWQQRYGAPVTDSELDELVALVRDPERSSTRS